MSPNLGLAVEAAAGVVEIGMALGVEPAIVARPVGVDVGGRAILRMCGSEGSERFRVPLGSETDGGRSWGHDGSSVGLPDGTARPVDDLPSPYPVRT